jgi:hypothetical protein
MRFSSLLSLVCALGSGWIPAPARGQADDFTVIALPDTQHYTCTSGGLCSAPLGIFGAQTEWIAANRDLLDIRFVATLGDCTQNGNVTSEFDIADAAFQTIEAASGPGLPRRDPVRGGRRQSRSSSERQSREHPDRERRE